MFAALTPAYFFGGKNMKKIPIYLLLFLGLTVLAACTGGKKAAPEDIDGGTVEHNTQKKPIQSKGITDFKCFFMAESEDEDIGSGEYYFSLEKDGDKVRGSVRCVGYNGMDGYDTNFITADETALADLQTLVEEAGLESFNGIYHETQGLPAGYGCEISVIYVSGERIYCFDNEDNRLSDEQMKAVINWFKEKTGLE